MDCKVRLGPDSLYRLPIPEAKARMPEIDAWLIDQAQNGVRGRVEEVEGEFRLLSTIKNPLMTAKLRWVG